MDYDLVPDISPVDQFEAFHRLEAPTEDGRNMADVNGNAAKSAIIEFDSEERRGGRVRTVQKPDFRGEWHEIQALFEGCKKRLRMNAWQPY
jgi:CRISPR/Cas system-associated protein Cas10 (large subunit of type III CRISPR-Cas system)